MPRLRVLRSEALSGAGVEGGGSWGRTHTAIGAYVEATALLSQTQRLQCAAELRARLVGAYRAVAARADHALLQQVCQNASSPSLKTSRRRVNATHTALSLIPS